MAHGMKPNAKLWRHICWRQYLHFLISQVSQFFYSAFELFKGSWKVKKFFQYLKYELRYDILNLDKFGAQKRENPFVNKTKFKSFIVESPLLFKLHITHLYYCWKVKGKEIWKKKNS